MTDGPADALREQAREWGRSLLAAPPWNAVSDRVSLLLVSPPVGLDVAANPAAWLVIDTAAARSLPPEYARALSIDAPLVERRRSTAAATTLVFATEVAIIRLLEATTPRALEARWQARHAEALVDRLRRGEQFALRAGLIPDDGVERVTRMLWLEASAAARGLDVLTTRPAEAIATAGGLAAAIARLACFTDDGNYSPAEFLLPAAAETRIGKRLAPWIADFVPALGGDEAAVRRVLGSRDQAMAEIAAVLGERFRDRPWLRDPDAYAFRTPR